MWYKNYTNPLKKSFHVTPKIHEDFKVFCNEEVIWTPETDVLGNLLNKIKKNIFYQEVIKEVDEYYMAFVLAFFNENKLAITDENIISFFSKDELSNPVRILLMADLYNHATTKNAAKFLALCNKKEPFEIWEKYLANHNNLFSDSYFTSTQFNNFLMERKKFLRSYIIELSKDKEVIHQNDFTIEINIRALLATNLIITKPDKNNALLLELMEQNIIHPLMVFPIGLYISENKTVFEHTIQRPQNHVMWWLEKSLIDFQDFFNFSEMIDFFEKDLGDDFHLNKFPPELANFKYIINLMKKIKFKREMELLSSKNEKEKLIKV